MNSAIKYCTSCGNQIELKIPPGDNRKRQVCDNCGTIQYQNPKIVSGCIPYWKDKILICKRAIEPRRGYWTIPAGYLEIGETIEQGAHRETWEEACAEVHNLNLYQIFDLPTIGQVYTIFTGELVDPDGFGVGEESLDVKMVTADEIPWDDLAFKVVSRSLMRFLEEKRSNRFTFEIGTIDHKW